MSPFETYILCIVLGLLFLGIELFVPGGILGLIGAGFLTVAVFLGFNDAVFGAGGGMFSAVAVLGGVCVYIAMVLKLFPHSFIGRRMTLANDMVLSKASDDSENDLLGQTGVAHSDLRPSGIATFGHRRIDVIAEGSFIARGDAVKVIRVQGNRVTVQAVESPT